MTKRTKRRVLAEATKETAAMGLIGTGVMMIEGAVDTTTQVVGAVCIIIGFALIAIDIWFIPE